MDGHSSYSVMANEVEHATHVLLVRSTSHRIRRPPLMTGLTTRNMMTFFTHMTAANNLRARFSGRSAACHAIAPGCARPSALQWQRPPPPPPAPRPAPTAGPDAVQGPPTGIPMVGSERLLLVHHSTPMHGRIPIANQNDDCVAHLVQQKTFLDLQPLV
jgi:hypothetical protein